MTRRSALLVLCVVMAIGEAAVLQGYAIQPGLALAPQVTAPGPFGVLHDLRWVMAFNSSYAQFAGLMVALFALRVGVLTACARLARPDGQPARPLRADLVRNAGFVALALVLLTPSATFLFADAIAPLWGLFVVALVLAVLPVAVLSGVPWGLPTWRSLSWSAVEAVVLMLGALAISVSPDWVTLLPAAATGAVNAAVWLALAHDMARLPATRPAPLGLSAAVVGVGLIAVGIAIGVQFTGSTVPRRAGLTGPRPTIVVPGFRSELAAGRPPLLAGVAQVQTFSYRGLDAGGRPRPYGKRATYQSLDVSARLLARQVDALHADSGRRVTLVGDSEGSMIAKLYLLENPAAPVDELIMTSPIVRPGRVVYPPPGQGGYGVATRFALRPLASFVTAAAVPISVHTPLILSIVRHANVLRYGMLCPLPGVRQLALLPLSDAIAEPPPVTSHIPLVVLPALHGDIAQAGDFRDRVVAALRGQPFPMSPAWRATARIVRGMAAAWQMPSLPLTHLGRPAIDVAACQPRR